jgi:hypothetical protein
MKQQTLETNIHALSGIRIRNTGNQVGADLHLVPHGHRGQSFLKYYMRVSATCFGFSPKMFRLFADTFSVNKQNIFRETKYETIFFDNTHINRLINLQQNLVFIFHKFAASIYSMPAHVLLPLLKFACGQIKIPKFINFDNYQ